MAGPTGGAESSAALMARLRTAAAVLILALAAAWVAQSILAGPEARSQAGTLTRPIDPRQQKLLAFGERSHWLQPWRGYLDTPPATRLRDAIGINFNVEPGEAEATATLLSRSGFRRARVEFGWDSLSYEDPARLKDPDRFRAVLGALERHGIRPLMLLNANHGAPGPTRFFSARLARPAEAGARRVRLAPSTSRLVEPGRSGLNATDGKAADILFTSIEANGEAALSKPLPEALPAGDQPAATLLYEPFGPPRLANGQPNPRFERTLAGWLDYSRTIVREARAVLGNDSFDVEIWNELSFGSDFLYQERYYSPPRERGKGDVTAAILERTVAALREESGQIGIGDGFASQTPFPSGATGPPGLTAIDKHPYYGIRRFPADTIQNGITPLDASGRPSFEEEKLASGDTARRDDFVPEYDAFFPEYILTGIQTETLIRDLSPITTDVYDTPHGRRAQPPGGTPPAVWITEANLDPTGADPADPSNVGAGPIDRLTAADVAHLQAKAALRYYTAFVNKGVSAVHLFAAKGDNLALVDPAFFDQLADSGGSYPGDDAGGETTRAVGRLAAALGGSRRMPRTRPLTLDAVSDDHGHVQFEGDGTAAHPPLLDREVTAFFPFQVRPGRYVAAAYVMTRNLAKPYGEGEGPDRYDLPEAAFRLRIGGIGGAKARASATDPLSGSEVPVEITSRKANSITIEVPLTDSPRLLTLTE